MKGTWRVENGRLCIDDGTPDAGCKEVWMSGNKVQFHFDTGRVIEGVLQKQQPRGGWIGRTGERAYEPSNAIRESIATSADG